MCRMNFTGLRLELIIFGNILLRKRSITLCNIITIHSLEFTPMEIGQPSKSLPEIF
ncbi:hypothetical protein Fmac_003728 [Flemingia macrophylla]|uniref:Uncharacterized protein n=1 Tax=Flemingia macrophylla TaxID=520843 RepID=A0ABD1N342_9FABA